ncbi:MAG: NAD(P)/FAD-dependent oxidoreductase [Rhizobiaceae bacterium]|nr:NAD(P)/FAD-dependent oxidoreductase [Rhizobiaceae bacterium]
MSTDSSHPLKIAVVGSGISGLSAAWLLSSRHEVSLFEAEKRIGGHSNTVDAGHSFVDTGFIVYNEQTYPNLTALFDHLEVRSKPSDMSFAVSLDGGRLEYSGTGLAGLLAQPSNVASPRFWRMMRELLRFYRQAPADIAAAGDISLADYLDAKGYGSAFRDDHLYPMAAAIWSTPSAEIGNYPAAAFIRFCDNHGLLKLTGRPVWRTVEGGSRQYVKRLAARLQGKVFAGCGIRSIARRAGGAWLTDAEGIVRRFDHVVIATHADQALRMLADARPDETAILGRFGYCRNEAWLHSDPCLMPRRHRAWSSWNYLAEGRGETRKLSVTYWMNRLQGLPDDTPFFVTLNPTVEPEPSSVVCRNTYEHPVFDAGTALAQRSLWSLQGIRNTWFCGAYFGAGFHEDGLQSGLAVAEALGGVRRPWAVADESGRIHISVAPPRSDAVAA